MDKPKQVQSKEADQPHSQRLCQTVVQQFNNINQEQAEKQRSLAYAISIVDSMDGEQAALKEIQNKIISQQQDFQRFRVMSQIMVDKSELLSQMIQITRLGILRPKKWGKSLNLSMMQYYFQLPTDNEGKTIVPNPNTYLFKGGPVPQQFLNKGSRNKHLSPLKISLNEQFMEMHHGKYPVIYMSFSNLKGLSQDQVHSSLVQKLKILYDKYPYLKNKQEYLQYKKQFQQNDVVDFGVCLFSLCQMLAQFHKRNCIVLIDQYDALFNNFTLKSEELYRIKLKVGRILQALSKQCKYVKNLIVMGVLSNQKNFGSAFDNTTFYDILRPKLSIFFGFSAAQIQQQLVKKLVTPFNKQKIDLLMGRIRIWYNGYECSETYGKKYKMYNPWSITKYLNRCIEQNTILIPQSQWNDSQNIQLIFKIFDNCLKKNKIQNVLLFINSQKCCKCSRLEQYPNKICKDENHKLSHIIIQDWHFSNRLNIHNIQNLNQFQLLIHLGFLTARKQMQQNCYQAFIPNNEIRQQIRGIFRRWEQKNKIQNGFGKIDILNTDHFVNIVSKYYESYKSNIGYLDEQILNSFFSVVYALSSSPSHQIIQQFYSGEGYIDKVYIPKQIKQNLYAVIHEYKFVQNHGEKQYNKAVIESIYQVLSKCYTKPLLQTYKNVGFKICAVIIFYQVGKSDVIFRNFQFDLSYQQAKQINAKYQNVRSKFSGNSLKNCKNFANYCFQSFQISDGKDLNLQKFILENLVFSQENFLFKLISNYVNQSSKRQRPSQRNDQDLSYSLRKRANDDE